MGSPESNDPVTVPRRSGPVAAPIPADDEPSAAATRPRARSRRSDPTSSWWRIRLFSGMVNDLRRRAPYYLSDWTDAWDYRVVPATVYMYFAKSVSWATIALLRQSPF